MVPQSCGYLLVLVAQCVANGAPLGAPEAIELLHPEIPQAPAKNLAEKTAAVPVIHLDTDGNGKATVDEYLDMFPQDLLSSNKKVKPIDVRKIEHEDFIDYEIEFLELSEEMDDGEELSMDHKHSDVGSDRIISSSDSVKHSSVDHAYNSSMNPHSKGLSEHPKEMSLVTFADLLRRARIRHQSKASTNDKRRRGRIKLKRDPVVHIPTSDTNDSSNQVDTNDEQHEENSYRYRSESWTQMYL